MVFLILQYDAALLLPHSQGALHLSSKEQQKINKANQWSQYKFKTQLLVSLIFIIELDKILFQQIHTILVNAHNFYNNVSNQAKSTSK